MEYCFKLVILVHLTGEVEFAFRAAMSYGYHYFFCGLPLGPLSQDMESYRHEARQFGLTPSIVVQFSIIATDCDELAGEIIFAYRIDWRCHGSSKSASVSASNPPILFSRYLHIPAFAGFYIPRPKTDSRDVEPTKCLSRLQPADCA